jgi:antitoxin VapB
MLAIPTETEDLARRVARKTGKNPEHVIHDALATNARSLGVDIAANNPSKTPEERIAAMMEVSDRLKTYPVLDDRSADEIIGYDEFGVPR